MRSGFKTKNARSAPIQSSAIAATKMGIQLPVAALRTFPSGTSNDAVPLRRVQQTVVCRGELPAKEVATYGGEQAVDLTPGEEHQTREHDEQARDVRKGDEEQDPDTLQAEGDEHRVFTADVIRDPTKEWPRQ